jgi:hypothetical protein
MSALHLAVPEDPVRDCNAMYLVLWRLTAGLAEKDGRSPKGA